MTDPRDASIDDDLRAAAAATRAADLGRGFALARQALNRCMGSADTEGEMRASNLLGAIAFERGDLDEADGAFTRALALAQQINDTLMAARASNNLASVAHLRGRPEVAASLYRRALLSYQRLGDRRGAAETWHNLGLSFRQMGDLHEAEAAALEAVRHAELTDDPGILALATLGRAEVRVERRDFEVAEREITRASGLFEQASDPIGAAETRRLRALLALYRQDFALAREEAQAAQLAGEQHESALVAAEAASLCALACRGLGQHEEAARHRGTAEACFNRLGAGALLRRLEDAWAASL